MSTNPATAPPSETPELGGHKLSPALAIGLFVLLVTSAGIAFWAQKNPGLAPVWLERSAPWVFLLFAVGFAAYRFALVAARRYSAFKAFFQVAVALMFFMLLLLPGTQAPVSGVAPAPVALSSLLADADPKVRALAAEVSGYREDQTQVKALIGLLSDPDPAVAEAAQKALVRLNQGNDLGNSPAKWQERFP